MDNRVREFINNKQKKKEEKRKELLINLGLYEKVYAKEIAADEEWTAGNSGEETYPYSEWDDISQTTIFFRKEALDITDEEYEEFKEYFVADDEKENNVVATVLTWIAWIIYIGGFFIGIAMGNVVADDYYSYSEFSMATAFVYWCIAFVSGSMFLGFSEIIKLLHDIRKKII